MLLRTVFGGYGVEALPEGAPSELTEAVRKDLAPAGHRVLNEGKPFADLWLRPILPAAAPHPGPKILYPALQPSGLVGVVRYHVEASDFKGHKIPPGVYTLRYAVQPDDGDHQDATPFRDFLVVCPAAADPAPAAMELKELQKISARMNGKKHPSVLCLAAGKGGPLPRAVQEAEQVRFEAEAPLPDGTKQRLSIVLVGKAPE